MQRESEFTERGHPEEHLGLRLRRSSKPSAFTAQGTSSTSIAGILYSSSTYSSQDVSYVVGLGADVTSFTLSLSIENSVAVGLFSYQQILNFYYTGTDQAVYYHVFTSDFTLVVADSGGDVTIEKNRVYYLVIIAYVEDTPVVFTGSYEMVKQDSSSSLSVARYVVPIVLLSICMMLFIWKKDEICFPPMKQEQEATAFPPAQPQQQPQRVASGSAIPVATAVNSREPIEGLASVRS